MSNDPVTIVGAGPVGTLLALLLARAGREVQLIERRSDPRRAAADSGRSINLALAARGLLALEQAGVLEQLRSEMVAMRGRQVHELGGASSFMNYGLRPTEVIHAISRTRLNAALIEVASQVPQITLRFSQRSIDVDPRSGTLQWRDEIDGSLHNEAAALLIAADGAGSAVRAALATRGMLQATEEALDHDYRELLIPAAADGGYLLDQNALHIWPRGGYMLIALPNPDGSFTATLFLPARGAPSFDYQLYQVMNELGYDDVYWVQRIRAPEGTRWDWERLCTVKASVPVQVAHLGPGKIAVLAVQSKGDAALYTLDFTTIGPKVTAKTIELKEGAAPKLKVEGGVPSVE